jgi:hypothetical protein
MMELNWNMRLSVQYLNDNFFCDKNLNKLMDLSKLPINDHS